MTMLDVAGLQHSIKKRGDLRVRRSIANPLRRCRPLQASLGNRVWSVKAVAFLQCTTSDKLLT
jgi:hypothetical protein